MSTTPPAEEPAKITDPVAAAVDAVLKKPASELAEAERTLRLLKLGAEAQKSEQEAKKLSTDAALARKQLRLSTVSAFSATFVPIVSLLTVMVTIWTSNVQLQQARDLEAQKITALERSAQAASWEAFRSTFDSLTPDQFYRRATFVARLREFAKNDQHRRELLDIARAFLADLSTYDAFKEVWKLTYEEVTADNFDNVISLARSKRKSFYQIAAECSEIQIPAGRLPQDTKFTYQGACSSTYTADDIAKAFFDNKVNADKLADLRNKLQDANRTTILLSRAIADYLRKASNKTTGGKSYDLSEVNFLDSNFDGVDFSKMILTNTGFALSSVNEASLDTKSPTYLFPGTSWWNVTAINQRVLAWLVANNYPGSPLAEYRPEKIAEQLYRDKISNLCTSRAVGCTQECIRYGSSPGPVPAQCGATDTGK